MAPTFELVSDKQFIVPSETKDDYDVFVFEYQGDPTRLDFIRPTSANWDAPVRVGNSEHAKFNALKVFGVTIQGKQLTELGHDLSLDGSINNHIFRLMVNRLGQCLVIRIKTPTITKLRINDYFGWSKYGVILPQGTPANVWNKCDMFNGETIVDIRSIMINGEQSKSEVDNLKKNLEEKQKRIESLNSELETYKKELEGTKQVAKKSNEVESLLNKLVHDKDKELEVKKLESAIREKELECMKEVVKRGKEMEHLLSKSVKDKENEVEKMERVVLAIRQQMESLKESYNSFLDDYV